MRVSTIRKTLWGHVEAFQARDLSPFALEHLLLDAVFEPMRRTGQTREGARRLGDLPGRATGGAASSPGQHGKRSQLVGVPPGPGAASPAPDPLRTGVSQRHEEAPGRPGGEAESRAGGARAPEVRADYQPAGADLRGRTASDQCHPALLDGTQCPEAHLGHPGPAQPAVATPDVEIKHMGQRRRELGLDSRVAPPAPKHRATLREADLFLLLQP